MVYFSMRVSSFVLPTNAPNEMSKYCCTPNINISIDVGYEVIQPDPPSECVDDSDIDYRTRRKRDRENRENNYESSY